MLSQMYRHLQSLLVLLCTLSLSFGKINAQACDENIRKALEQTRITTFSNVTQGEIGEFVIRYPLAGTKYTFRDQAGNAYDYTYTGTPVQISVAIAVGVVNSERKFSFTAQKGSCSYTSGFDYTITPQTAAALSVRVEQEWCERGGGIFFKLIGNSVNENDYTFHYKKSSQANYDYTKQLSSSSGIEAIVAGSYDLIAKHKTNPSKNIEQKNILVKSTVENVEYNVLYVPAVCPGTNGDVKVNITKGKYPLFFTLLKQDDTPYSQATTRQTSNVFTNVPVGQYKVKVEDFCAIGGGNAPQPQSASVKNFNFNLKKIYSAEGWEYSCDYVTFSGIWLEGDNLHEVLEGDALPYPFNIQLIFESPTHRTYTKTITISDRRELEQKFSYVYQNNEVKYLNLKNAIREGYPIEYGNWKAKAILTSACGSMTLTEKQVPVANPFNEVNVMTEVKGAACKSIAIVRNPIYSRTSSSDTNIPVYFVLESYPSSFNPEAAGFYKITTTNPSLINKYVKRIDYNGPNLVDPELLNAGDKFKFKAVYDSCNREKTFPEIIIPANTPVPSVIYLHPVGGCKGVSATGTDYATLVIEQRSGSPINQIVIRSTNADISKLPAGMTLPYTLKDSEHITNNYWMVKDLPQGEYVIEHTNACGATASQRYDLIGDTYNISWVENCTPKLSFTYTSAQTKNYTSYFIQRYDEPTQRWVLAQNLYVRYGANEFTIDGNTQGKFRLVRSVNASSQYMGTTQSYDCQQVISEKEYKGTLKDPKVFGLGCPSTSVHHVLVVPQGGTPPYTYKLVSKDIAGQTPQILNKSGEDDNFFLNVDASNLTARYVFQVTDACGEAKTVDYRVSNFLPPTLTAEQEYYCTGQSARLSIPKMGNNVRIDWYRSDNPTTPIATNTNTLYIPSLTEDDFIHTYSVKLTGNHSADVNACVAAAVIQAYQFKRKLVSAPAITMPANTPVTKCVSADETFDLNTLFNIPPALTTYLTNNPSVKPKLTDEAAILSIPANGKVNLNSIEFISKTHTIVYSLDSACGQKILEVKNTITVETQINISTGSSVNLCSANPTYDEVAQYIKDNNNSVRNSLVSFDWYSTLSDANAKTNKQVGTASIGSISETTPITLYLRYSKVGFCDSGVMTIQVKKIATAAPATKSLGAVCALTVGELKKLIDPTDYANVVVYLNNNALVDNYYLGSDTNVFYTKKVGSCETAKAKVNFTLQPVSQAAPQTLSLCVTTNQNGSLVVTNESVKTALKTLYPTTETNGVKLYQKESSREKYNEYTETLIPINQVLYFTIKETNKCTSSYYRVLLSASSSQTTATSVTAALCADATVADLRTAIGSAHQIKIYKEETLQTDAMSIDWDKADKYTYTIDQIGACESLKGFINLIKSNNATPIIPKIVSFCGSVLQTVGAVKTQIGDPSAKIYVKSGNHYNEQADAVVINPALTYYYTVQNAGKCVSDKAIVSIVTAQTTAQPAGPNITTGCVKTVGELKANIRTQEPARSSEILTIYAGLSEANKGTALADNTTLIQTTYAYSYTEGTKCESALRHITINRVATPTVTQTTQSFCTNATIANLQPQGANIVWYATDTAVTPLAATTPLVAGNTYYVAQKSSNCESARIAVNVVYSNTISLSVPAPLTIACNDTNANTAVANWLNQATVTDTCGTATLTHNYTAVKPTNWCNSSVVTITFVGKDPLGNTITKTSTIKVLQIDAVDDTHTSIINGTSGTNNVIDVLQNDTVGGVPVTTSNVQITVVTPASGGANVPTLNTSTGKISVPAGTKSGTYTIQYKICHTENSVTVCDTATATVKVGSTPIVAKADTYTITNGTSTTTTTGTVFDNDKIGTKTPTTTDVILTVVTSTTDVVGATSTPTLNNNGTITVPSGTKSGTYQIVYSICERLNPDNCATATATVKVFVPTVVTPTTIEAVNDGVTTITSTIGGTTPSVLTNDKLNGVANPSVSTVTLTWNTATPTGFTLNPNGTIAVAPNTPAGIHTISYTICAVASPTVCSTASIVVTISGTTTIATPTTIEAVNDGVTTITSTAGGTTPSVLTNDKLNGVPNPSISSVTLTWNTATPTGFTLNPNGTIAVAPNTPAGIHTISYTICAVASPTVCSTASIVVTISGTTTIATPTTIEAVNDGVTTITSTAGGTTPSVLTNDKLNGVPNPSISSVTLTWNTATPTGFTLNPNGTIAVAPNTPAGIHTISYTICAVASPTVCSTASIVVTISGTTTIATPTTIEAVNDGVTTITSTAGGTTPSVLTNDKLNGVPNPSISSVTLTWNTATPTGFTLNPNGTIAVAPNTPAGIHTISYTICAVASPTVCSTASIVVTISGTTTIATPTTIEAVNDGVTTITSTAGGTTPSVLTNDKLNGVPNPSISSVTLTWNTATPTGFTLNPNGTIAVAPNTPAGIHTISYTICAVASPTVCSTASIVVTVSGTTTSTTPVLPIAVDDRSTTAINTPVVVNVLGNDTPNGATTPNVVTNPANGTVVVNLDGSIEYRPNTGFEGIDTFVYEICNTDGCASATVTINVVNKIVPYNGMSVDGDGKNDHFHIGGIERYPNNVVRIYNRWGVKVFETEGYDNVTRVFRGISNGRVTIEQAEKLAQGTYYYVIEYYDSNNNKESLVGWLYLKK